MYDLIIIGGGPAGITAGIYAARKNLKTLLLTKDFIGQLGDAGVIENWPGNISVTGPQLMQNFENHLRTFEIDIKEEKVLTVEKSETFEIRSEEKNYKAKAVIITTGRNPRPLNLPGEKEYVGKGVSYCVTCDGPLFRDKRVVVVGGGNAGLEGALELSEYAKEVYVLELAEKLPGDELLVKQISKKPNITVLLQARAEVIKGSDFVEELVYQDLADNKKKTIETKGIFVRIGSIPVTNILNSLVDYNKKGEIVIDYETCTTKTTGLFAAGDVTNVQGKQVIVAAGEGCKALLSAYDYIKKHA